MRKKGGSKFYDTEEFKALYELWVRSKKTKTTQKGKILTKVIPSKLQKAGFIDIERPSGALKSPDPRTQNYQHRDQMLRISTALSAYISNQDIEIDSLTRKILQLHSEGTQQKQIARSTKKSRMTIWRIIKNHLPIALSLYSDDSEEL